MREIVDPIDQTTDVKNCLAYLVSEPGVDAARVGLWGSSYGGGHVVFTAGGDDRVKAVVAQIGGYGFPDSARETARGRQADRARGTIDPPVPQGGLDATPGLKGTPDIARMAEHFPLRAAQNVRVPVLFMDAEFEELMDRHQHGEAAYKIVRENAPSEYHTFPGKHYDVYDKFFQPSVDMALDWYAKHRTRRHFMQNIAGKVAVVTGGASGIGLALAQAFGAEDAKVVIADIEQGALDRAADQLRSSGYDVLGVLCDVSKFDQVEALTRAAVERFGKVHIVCNNAGVSITGPIFEVSLDDWRWVYGVNVWGIIHGIKAFVPMLMAQDEDTHVVNVASLASFNGTGEHAPYCSSKAAALSLSQALFSEMAALDTKVGVSVVCPGMVATAIHKSWRNRPKEDRPWSDREFADERFVQGSDRFQGSGAPPEEIARLTLEAIKQNRFYVFNGERWSQYVRAFTEPAVKGENPPVLTWGEDRRPKAEPASAAAE